MNPERPLGKLELIDGIGHAATNTLRIRIKGKGGHGATPHLCIDPIVAGAYLVTQLQTVTSRYLSPLDSAVVTIGQFHAGTAENIIPEEATLLGTLRTLRPEVRMLALRRINAMVRGLDITFGVTSAVENIGRLSCPGQSFRTFEFYEIMRRRDIRCRSRLYRPPADGS